MFGDFLATADFQFSNFVMNEKPDVAFACQSSMMAFFFFLNLLPSHL